MKPFRRGRLHVAPGPCAAARKDPATLSGFEIFDLLRGTSCTCGGEKVPRRSFCVACFHRLPYPHQVALQVRGLAYIAAFRAAAAWLSQNHQDKTANQQIEP